MSATTEYAGIGSPETIALPELNTFHRNPRQGDVQAIKGSIQANGLYRPIIVNRGSHTGRSNEVLAGNHTLKAYRELAEEHPGDYATIDCWVVDVDDDRANRIVLADNRTADLGDYDEAQLLELLNEVDYDLDGTGYDYEYLDELVELAEKSGGGEPNDDYAEPETPPATPTSKLGDIWVLGPHRLLVGDATDTEAVSAMMGDNPADCIWTDPPYGVEYVGKTKDSLTIQNDKTSDLPEMLLGAFTTAIRVSKPGAPIYVAHADTERTAFEKAMREAGLLVRQNLVWVKNTIALGHSDYHYRHEPILYGFTPDGQGRLGRGGDRWYGNNAQSTVFEIDKPARNADHPTMKPPALITAMLNNSLRPGGIVLDLFAGSGSTMVAAHQHGSSARLVELDPRYADVICRRYQDLTGEIPKRGGQAVNFFDSEN